MRILAATISVLLICSSAARAAPRPDPHEWTPDADIVAHVDSLALGFALPAEFGALKDYGRYYWGTARDGHRLIEGVFISPQIALAAREDSSNRIYIVPEGSVPAIGDGGCMVVNVEFDVDADLIVSTRCNFDLRAPPPPPQDR